MRVARLVAEELRGRGDATAIGLASVKIKTGLGQSRAGKHPLRLSDERRGKAWAEQAKQKGERFLMHALSYPKPRR